MTTKGRLKVHLEEFHVEWQIGNFLSLSHADGEFYTSPSFFFADAYWSLDVYPNGNAEFNSKGFISLYLYRKSAGPQMDIECSFRLKTLDPQEDGDKQLAHVFIKRKKVYGVPFFLPRSELKKRKEDLMPSDIFTVLCSLKFPKSDEVTSDIATAKCLYCKENVEVKSFQAHEKKCMNKPIKCPECSEVVALKNWYEHKCQTEKTKDHGSLVRDYKKVLLDGKNYDFVMKIGDKELKAHRDILRARSPVFESMLNHNMAEKNSGVIEVPDCDPQAMEQFLSYVYCGKVETLDQSNMLELYYIADKYDMSCLKEKCNDFIKKSLSISNVCEVLQLALNHSDNSLLENASAYFMGNVLDIMRTGEWQAFLKDNSTVGNELLIKAFEKMKNVNI